MPQLLVRRISEDVMDNLRTEAKAEGISVEELARRILRDQTERRVRWRAFADWSVRFTESQKSSANQREPSSTRVIRRDRDR